jgi:hypothetical protein
MVEKKENEKVALMDEMTVPLMAEQLEIESAEEKAFGMVDKLVAA